MSEPTAPHPSGVPLPELAAAITAGAVRLAAATAAWLRLVAEFDEREGWHGYGIASCAHWLSWQCGLSPGAAREHVRVARALRGLPLIEVAFAEGRLSYSKVRALTRIAEPDTEVSLLELAGHLTASQVERTVRQWRRADASNAGQPPPEAQPSFRHWWDESGMLTVQIRMSTEPGAAFMAAVESVAERTARRERARAGRTRVDPAPGDEPADLLPERLADRRLAALSTLAEVAAHADRRPGDPPRREVVVHVDAAVLADDAAAGRAYVEGGPAVTAAVARRMLCEATVVAMLENGREPLGVGRRKRRATRAQRMALLRRDGGCARPGCPESRIERLHAHHMRHVLFGGRTDMANLVLLCDRDHGLAHDLDLVMSRVSGQLVVTAPDGHRVWGPADVVFRDGLPGLEESSARDHEAFSGVHPIDTALGRRPTCSTVAADGVSTPGTERSSPSAPCGRQSPTGAGLGSHRRGIRAGRHPRAGIAGPTPPGPCRPGGRPTVHRTPDARSVSQARRPGRAIGATLFPDGEPALPDAMAANGERMDVRYVVGVLMGNRDLVRRLRAEAAGVPAGTP